MNIKDIVIVFSLALLSSWAIQYFFLDKRVDTKNEISFVGVAQKQCTDPLRTEVDFMQAKRSAKMVSTPVETNWASIIFSTDGASIESLAFKRDINGKNELISTIFAPTDHKEQRAFLVALDEKTPFFYQLLDKKVGDETITLTYQGANDTTTITKTFVVYTNKHQIDLKIDVHATKGNTVGHLRLLYPAPFMPVLGSEEAISGLLIQRDGVFNKIPLKTIVEENKGWYEPQLLGGEDRYFIHALVADPAQFVRRAYYTSSREKQLTAIAESDAVTDTGTWTLSIYVGPKEASAIEVVDPRLEQALEYSGWLAPLSKFMLAILKWLYRYLHNFGFAIIVLTIGIKLCLLPFTIGTEQKMQAQKEAQKKLAYLEKKYKDDPDRLGLERAEFMKKHGLPGLGGCLPLLLQIPIFFALSRILSNSIELYNAPWLWISNLSAKDPYYILPLLVFMTLLLQALTGGGKAGVGSPVKGNEYLFGLATALLFGAITSSLSAGLALYIFVSTLMQVLQGLVVNFGKRTA